MRSVLGPVVAGLILNGVPGGAYTIPPLENGWYVAQDACPGELARESADLCRFSSALVAIQDTVLYERARSDRQIATAHEGQIVILSTGDFYTRPIQVETRYPTILRGHDSSWSSGRVVRLSIGERFYLLSRQGEGYYTAWLHGAPRSLNARRMISPDGESFASCPAPSEECWWRVGQESREMESEWWIKLHLDDGTEGWTKELGRFRSVERVLPGRGPPLEDGWYVHRSICPFEYCKYGRQSYDEERPLYERPQGSRQVGVVRAGETVEELTGDVYSRPIVADVIYPTPMGWIPELHMPLEAARGERLYLLHYDGEGYYLGWFRGQLVSLDITSMIVSGSQPMTFKSCETPSKHCWWRIAPEQRRVQAEWWIKTRLPDGTEGWAKDNGLDEVTVWINELP